MPTALPRLRSFQRPLWPFTINRSSPQATGLVFWAPVTNPLALDLHGNRLGSIAGATLSVAPIHGMVASFDGNDYIDFGPVAMPTSPVTVSAWARYHTSPLGQANIFSKGYDGTNTQWSIYTGDASAVPVFASFDGAVRGVTATSALSSTDFSLIVGTYDGTTYRIYVNGRLEASNVATAPTATAKPLYIGGVDVNGTPGQFWTGGIFDCRVYSRVLSDGEVSAMYDLQTRWDLYWQPPRRVFVKLPAGGGFKPWFARNSNSVMQGGMTGGMQ